MLLDISPLCLYHNIPMILTHYLAKRVPTLGDPPSEHLGCGSLHSNANWNSGNSTIEELRIRTGYKIHCIYFR